MQNHEPQTLNNSLTPFPRLDEFLAGATFVVVGIAFLYGNTEFTQLRLISMFLGGLVMIAFFERGRWKARKLQKENSNGR